MQASPKLYLAGPEAFLPDAIEIGRRKKALCAEYGFDGQYPFDNEVEAAENSRRVDRLIYGANAEMIRSADGGIFNLTPFRGISADAGTVFELGFLVGLGKPAFGYSNDSRTLLERMKDNGAAVFDAEAKLWRDRDGMAIENFDNADNLMIDNSLFAQGEDRFVRTRASLDDLSGFIECLARAARHFGFVPRHKQRAV